MSHCPQDAPLVCSGRRFTVAELDWVRETVALFPRLPLTELAATLCELLAWVTPNGTYKTASCRKLLESLEAAGEVELPRRRPYRRRAQAVADFRGASDPGPPLGGSLADLGPLTAHPVTTRAERSLWQEYVQRYHPLGYKQPFGAHLRYFVSATRVSERPGLTGLRRKRLRGVSSLPLRPGRWRVGTPGLGGLPKTAADGCTLWSTIPAFCYSPGCGCLTWPARCYLW